MMIFLAGARYFFLPMHESPKFLIATGRDEDAVAVIHAIAKENRVVSTLTLQDLRDAAAPFTDYTDEKAAQSEYTTMALLKNVG